VFLIRIEIHTTDALADFRGRQSFMSYGHKVKRIAVKLIAKISEHGYGLGQFLPGQVNVFEPNDHWAVGLEVEQF
jgi:hypothetical protein